ncbi:TPA: SIR2 family protein [Pseudomonas aeruginosa]|uniref:SIR2 family protein n=1 Tax=Pseudomonas aeruginosa TaxID=287 RepID=UPI001C8C32BA|nr:SIR2 family protein [Pseudomonas aeruginosa]ELK4808426.1 SIR2 family protein [Pseudomonas aeruginosa]MDV7887434.1 SIR2 family protein [Pseudomonas aeruginosa]HBO1017990.1 SIR2 family protein [Pseudomonas aeruginosa]HCF7395679.1 SIR2 family protein [Pseudomonas aeruginosa]HCF7401700.1 SIR2 family protein [Pseudomonas aeruginosa]
MSMGIKERLIEIFKARGSGPFLFVGSGFSRRYLGLEDWRGLLERFCVAGRPFEYYLARANGDYPTIATLLAKDFNEVWWKSEEYAESVGRYKSRIEDETSALRIEICNYLSTLDQSKALSSQYKAEVELLSGLNVDGVITTNWDMFIEQLFPEHRTYIGQDQLLFANPQEIGEIYKIHGCSTDPSSLVLTKSDYLQFQERNTYLAAKLITLFVEHPIVFIGYSISDENISGLLRAIAACIGREKVEQLRRNLIFVQRLYSGEEPNISDTYLAIDGVQIPLVLVKTNDFSEVYLAIEATKRKIPARVLRYCKEQLYELVKSSEPEKKICVVDIDEIEAKEDVEFLVGVGVASKEITGPAPVGYAAIEVSDLIEDLLLDNKKLDAGRVVANVLARLSRGTPYVPVFKYLKAIGVNSFEEYKALGVNIDRVVCKDIKTYRLKMYSKPYFRNYRHKNIRELIEACTPENAAAYIPFIPRNQIDVEVLREFLLDNLDKMEYRGCIYASSFKKLAALYDRLVYGW